MVAIKQRDRDMNISSETDEIALYAPVYDFVRTVPPGKVVTYGQVAGSITGIALTARQVGYAMAIAPDDVPWQRVVGAGGALPIGKRGPEAGRRQRQILENEGVAFLGSARDRVDMARHQWLAAEKEQPGLFDA